ncbi:MAG: hypothetical protein KC434_20460, partial [Anaerolineales bacterium]|nr:hypothetical protein [Anaerolineales bacterium]
MNERFDWQIGEEEDGRISPHPTAVSRQSRLWFWLGLTAVLLLSGGWLWRTLQAQLADAGHAAVEMTQVALNFERDAYLAGDGDLFYSFQASQPDWFSAQLQPLNGRLYRHNPIITQAERHDAYFWANVQWAEGSQIYQRVAFWQMQPDGSLIHQPEAPGYWGGFDSALYPWGQLDYFQIDADLAGQIGPYVTAQIAALCRDNCPTAERPFILTLANDFAETAAPNQMRVPSPRLVGLDENGAPSDLFWELLDGRLVDRFGRITLRF